MRRYTNTAAEAALAADATATDDVLTVNTTLGWVEPGEGDVAVAVLAYDDPNFIEVVTYTGLTPTSLTGVSRGLDGTIANSHPAGTVVQHAASAKDVERALGAIEQVAAEGDLLVGADVGVVTRLAKGAGGSALVVDSTTGDIIWGTRVTTAELEAHVEQEVSQARDAIEQGQTDAAASHKVAADAHTAYAYTINQSAMDGPLDRERPSEAHVPNGQAWFSLFNSPPGVDERKQITVSNATTGNFTLQQLPATDTTTFIAHNATASQVQSALEALPAIGAGNVVCAGGPLGTAPITIDYVNALEAQNIDTLQIPSNSTDGSIVIQTTRAGLNFGMLSKDKLVKMEPTANWTP